MEEERKKTPAELKRAKAHVKLFKNGREIAVHKSCVNDHLRLGWSKDK